MKEGCLIFYDYYEEDYLELDCSGILSMGSFYFYDDWIYYPMEDGTCRVSLYGGEREKISDYYLAEICFSSSGKLYAWGYSTVEGVENYGEVDAYLRMNLDGSKVEVLNMP